MFTLPPLPPKDYILRDVNQNQKSVQEHTPFALPRITQSSLGKFCAPVQYQENEKLANLDVDFSVNSQILDRWTDRQRAFWVDKPGKNAHFLHDVFKKYSVEVVPSYDVRFKHNERVFYRSFMYEIDCMEESRLKKLHKKTEREENEEKKKMDKMEEDKITKIDTSMGVKSCKHETPFYWPQEKDKSFAKDVATTTDQIDETIQETFANLRWAEKPHLLPAAKIDPCQRRLDMALIGLPFRNEACNWYYHHYPPPNLRFIPKRFA